MEQMSLRKMAGEMGITPAYLSMMVNGKRPWREDIREIYSRLVNTASQTVNRIDNSGQGELSRYTQGSAVSSGGGLWWGIVDSNHGPQSYQDRI